MLKWAVSDSEPSLDSAQHQLISFLGGLHPKPRHPKPRKSGPRMPACSQKLYPIRAIADGVGRSTQVTKGQMLEASELPRTRRPSTFQTKSLSSEQRQRHHP